MKDVPHRDADRSMAADERGQAFTLEGFIASVVILTAVLFALQSIVISPTTGGTVDQEVKSQLRTQAHDILVVSAHNDSQDLSYLVRYWNGTENTWAGAIDNTIGYGSETPPTAFGDMLNKTFKQRGRVYNVVVEYRNGTDPTKSNTERMVYRGVPSDNAVVTTYTITLYDNQTLEGPKVKNNPGALCGGFNSSDEVTLANVSTDYSGCNGYYPVPDAFPNSPIYNVIEIRVVVW